MRCSLNQSFQPSYYAHIKPRQNTHVSITDLFITPMLPSKVQSQRSIEERKTNILRAPFKLRLRLAVNRRTVVKIRLTYLITRAQNDLEIPKQYIDIDSPDNPIRMTGLRPTRSEALLQCSTVKAWVRKKRDCLTIHIN